MCIHNVGIKASWQGLVRASVLSVMSVVHPPSSHTVSSLAVLNWRHPTLVVTEAADSHVRMGAAMTRTGRVDSK